LGRIVEFIIRDFVDFWYNGTISGDQEFRFHVIQVLTAALGRVGQLASDLPVPSLLLHDVVDAVAFHMRWTDIMRRRAIKRNRDAFSRVRPEDIAAKATLRGAALARADETKAKAEASGSLDE